jgi:uncharacterized membrane protein
MADNPAKPSRLWRIVLVCSLALNLAVAGIVIGTVSSGRAGDGPPRNFDLGVGPMARALSPQERRQIGRSLRQDRALRGVDLRDRLARMSDSLRAEPFDPAALAGLLDAQNTQMAGVQDQAQEALLNTIAAMTSARRAEFADQLMAEFSKERRRPPRPNSGD